MKETILVVYMPVLHAGYITFLKENQYPLYIVGQDVLGEIAKKTPYYGREIRLVDPKQMKRAISSLKIVPSVNVLDIKTLKKMADFKGKIILPDEDISHEIGDTFLSNNKIVFKPVFLRWNKRITEKEHEVDPNRVISKKLFDREMMDTAMQEASGSSDWWRQVGVVIVKSGKILFQGHNKHVPSPHSPYSMGDPRNSYNAGERIDLSTALHGEAGLIARASREGVSIEGTSMYVTTFPCPQCAKLIVEAGIRKVYYSKGYSLLDAETLFNAHSIEIILVE